MVVDFVKTNIFARFGTPKAIISNRVTHFCNHTLEAVLKKYGVTHWVSTACHPQINGQAEASNLQIEGINIIVKTINPIKKDWIDWMMYYGLIGQHTKLQSTCHHIE